MAGSPVWRGTPGAQQPMRLVTADVVRSRALTVSHGLSVIRHSSSSHLRSLQLFQLWEPDRE